MSIIQKIEQEQLKPNISSFKVGDTIRVHTRVVEGDKERIQIFTGIVIGTARHRAQFDVHRSPHLLRGRRGTCFPFALPAHRQDRSRASRECAPVQAQLPSRSQRQASHDGEREISELKFCSMPPAALDSRSISGRQAFLLLPALMKQDAARSQDLSLQRLPFCRPNSRLRGLNDSKQLTEAGSRAIL